MRVSPTFAIVDGVCTCKAGKECARPGKHSRIKGWQQRATRNEVVVYDWFDNKFLPANIAIITGDRLPSGGFLTVLDIDRRNFGFGTLAALRDEGIDLDRTYTVTTGDGLHYYYSSSFKIASTSLGRGIDIQGVGGYVLGPGSTHANGGLYVVKNDLAIASLPEPLADLLAADVKRTQELIPIGQRHRRLRACSYAMALQGYDVDAILNALRQMLARCEVDTARKIFGEELQSLAQSAVAKVQRASAIMSKIVA